jgi:hypothetical protein
MPNYWNFHNNLVKYGILKNGKKVFLLWESLSICIKQML